MYTGFLDYISRRFWKVIFIWFFSLDIFDEALGAQSVAVIACVVWYRCEVEKRAPMSRMSWLYLLSEKD